MEASISAHFEILWLCHGATERKNASLRLKRGCALRWKNSQALFFPQENFPFPWSGLSNLARNESSLSEKKVRLRVFPSLSNFFPAARNIYSLLCHIFTKVANFKGLFEHQICNENWWEWYCATSNLVYFEILNQKGGKCYFYFWRFLDNNGPFVAVCVN